MTVTDRSFHLLTLAALITFVVSIAGCASHPTPQRASQPSSGYAADQSIIVPDGSSTLAKGLRGALAGRGWRLESYSNGMSRGHADYAAMARRARYRLTLMATPVSPCRNDGQSFRYRIAIIQNIGGDVPIAMAGADCLQSILAEFSADLDQRQWAPRSLHSGANSTGSAQ